MSKPVLKQVFDVFMQGIYGNNADADSIVIAKDNLDGAQCLGIYRSSVLGGLTQALGDIYPAIKRCVGEQFFDAMAGRYITQYPSRSASLDDYGEHLSSFIKTFDPLNDYPYMSDLASVEWAWHRAFHAPDEDALNPEMLQQMSPEDQTGLSFKLNQSVYLFESLYPISKIWHMNRGFLNVEEIDLSQGAERIVVWRNGYDVRVDVLPDLEFEFLLCIKNGLSLGTIYEQLLSKGANNEELVSALVTTISSGRLTGFKKQ